MFDIAFEQEWLIVATLVFLVSFLGVIWIKEYYQLQRSIQKLPIRIHVNGSRGKSSVTRLIAAGLRAGGLKTLAKTTGTSPRIIDDTGNDLFIHRLRRPTISEQIRILKDFAKEKPDVVVMECMAVQPQYQWISEQRMVKSTIGVITNVRPDHLPEMGPLMEDVTRSLGNSIPFNGKLVTTKSDHSNVLSEISKLRNTTMDVVSGDEVSSETVNQFPYLEHRENIAVALKTCELAGIKREAALKGMVKSRPDPGALSFTELIFGEHKNTFVNALAANDPDSTLMAWKICLDHVERPKSCLFLNTRDDRRYRTMQMLYMAEHTIKPDAIIIRGDNLPSLKKYEKMCHLKVFSNSAKPKDVAEYFSKFDDYLIFSAGNMVGWGQEFVDYLMKNHKDG